MVSIKVSGLLAEWGHSVWRSFLKALWKDPHPPFSAISGHNCVCLCVCVSYCVQALLGFSGVWTAGRVVLIGQNDAEMDRKPLWSSWCSFSLSLTFTLSLRFNHSHPPSSSSFRSSLHQHRSAFSALAVKRPRCCSTNFSHPFIPAIRPFPKSTLSQRGEAFSHWLLLHGNISLFRSSFSFFCKSFFLSVFPFHFCLSLAVFLLSHYVFFLRSFYSTLTVLGQFFLLALLSFTHIYFIFFYILKFPGNITS